MHGYLLVEPLITVYICKFWLLLIFLVLVANCHFRPCSLHLKGLIAIKCPYANITILFVALIVSTTLIISVALLLKNGGKKIKFQSNAKFMFLQYIPVWL